MKAIILAAGYATRLYPLTKDFPKALLSVGGQPLLDHILNQLNKIPEIDQIHVVSNARFYPVFFQWAQAKQDPRLHVHNDGTQDDATRLGAIGDIDYVLKTAELNDDCLIVAGDNLLMIDYAEFFNAYRKNSSLSTLLVQKMQDAATLQRFAVAVLDEQNHVTHLVEKPKNPPSEYGVFALYLYPASVMRMISRYLAEGNSPDAPGNFPVWLVQHKVPVCAYITDAPCYDIGTHESLRFVRNLYGE